MVQSILFPLLQKQYRYIFVCPYHPLEKNVFLIIAQVFYVFTFNFVNSYVIPHMNTFLCKENGRDQVASTIC